MSDDADLTVAALAETPEQLAHLFSEKRQCWEIAGFGSVLVQQRAKLQRAVDAHLAKVGSQSGRRVTNIHELEALNDAVESRLGQLQVDLQQAMFAPAFRRVFGDHDLYDDDPTPAEVVAAATLVTDFYRDNLVLARETRGVDGPAHYLEVIDNIARLVDRPLDDVDEFITRIVGFVAVIPKLGWQDSEPTEFHTLALDIGVDDALERRISQQIKRLRQPWRRWFA